MKNADQIVALYNERRIQRAPVFARMDEVRRTYNGELVVPLPELNKDERAAVANLVQTGIDQTAMRCASVIPGIAYPPLRPGIKVSERKARVRRDANLTWWDRNLIDMKLRRRSRYMLGYGTAPALIKPRPDRDDRNQSRVLPAWFAPNPLATFPAECSDPDDVVPPDCIFAHLRSREWVQREYPAQYRALRKNPTTKTFTLLEYVSAEQITCLVIGDRDETFGATSGGDKWAVLHNLANRAGVPLAVVPGRVTLDRVMGQFDGMIGMYQTQAKLMALNLIGTERSIFPETWLIVPPGGTQANIVVQADPKSGTTGVAEGARIEQISTGVGPYAAQAIAQLDNAQRMTGPVPTEYGGRGSVNTRTGRRGEQVLSEAVDFHIQEIQVLLERSLEAENRTAVAIAKSYESRTVSFYVPGRGTVEYTPAHFESDVNEVKYPYAGADLNGTVIQAGQMIGMETLSRETFMEIHPMIRDVETEKDRIQAEAVSKALLTSIQTQAADPNSPLLPTDWARITELVASDKMELAEAVQKVHEEVQARQAAQAQAAQPEAPPGPEMMPGINPPAPQRPDLAPIADSGPGIQNLANLMTRLRRPAMALPGEGMPTQAAAV